MWMMPRILRDHGRGIVVTKGQRQGIAPILAGIVYERHVLFGNHFYGYLVNNFRDGSITSHRHIQTTRAPEAIPFQSWRTTQIQTQTQTPSTAGIYSTCLSTDWLCRTGIDPDDPQSFISGFCSHVIFNLNSGRGWATLLRQAQRD